LTNILFGFGVTLHWDENFHKVPPQLQIRNWYRPPLMPISTAQFCVFACDTWRRPDVIFIFRCKGFDSWQTPEEHTLKVRRCVTFCKPHAHIFWDFFSTNKTKFLWHFWQNIACRDKSPSSIQNVRRYGTYCPQYLDIWIHCRSTESIFLWLRASTGELSAPKPRDLPFWKVFE